MRVTIIGFGLIGGSLARALAGTSWNVAAWSPGGSGPGRALAEGVVAAAPRRLEDALGGAELVVLAAPPLACLDLVANLGGPLGRSLGAGTTVTDVASTKARLVAAADEARLRFVGGHPMAGLETSGYAAARPDLFRGRPWVVVPGSRAEATDIERVETLAIAAGAVPVRLDAAAHDAAAAAISHLPLILAAALVEAVSGASDWPTARALAAGGWRDMTRLARGDGAMGAGILATNGSAVVERLRALRAVLDGWLEDLAAVDAAESGGPEGRAVERLQGRLEAARARLEST